MVLDDNATDVSIAVNHPLFGDSSTEVFLSYISNGRVRILRTEPRSKMESHIWTDTGETEMATAHALTYDGYMPKNARGVSEFITIGDPYLFWVRNGELWVRQLGSDDKTPLAIDGVTDVTAIRAPWATIDRFDFGLVAFYIQAGEIWYRQFKNDIWYDPIKVDFNPGSSKWVSIVSSRTWDYRVVIQAKDAKGGVYELITQFLSLGKDSLEHVDITEVHAEVNMIDVNKINLEAREFIDISNVDSFVRPVGIQSPRILSVKNIEVGGDWGKALVVEFDNYLDVDSVNENATSFSLIDSYGVEYGVSSVDMVKGDLIGIFKFADFNNAYGECTFNYTPGSAKTLIDGDVDYMSYKFTPINLKPTSKPLPEVEVIWNE